MADDKTIILVPADSDRVCNVSYGTEKIHNRGKSTKGYRNLNLAKGDETFTEKQSRFSHPELKEKKRMTKFRITGEVLNVPGAGQVSVAYSWKKQEKKESFKAILCSESSWNTEKIAEYYMLRWQIEIYFREIKGGLGINDFS